MVDPCSATWQQPTRCTQSACQCTASLIGRWMKDNQPTTAKGEDEIHLLKEIYTMLVCTYMSRVCEHLYTHVTCVHTCPPALMGGNPMMNVGEHSGCRPRPVPPGKNELSTTTEKKHAVSLGMDTRIPPEGVHLPPHRHLPHACRYVLDAQETNSTFVK